MFVICWSPKGGSGTSVVAAALALDRAADAEETLLVDLDGDQPAVLGVAGADAGVADWLAAPDVPVDALVALERPVGDRLRLLGRGRADLSQPDPDRLELMAGVLAVSSRTVVVDAGPTARYRWWGGVGGTVVVVLRPCYLGSRRLIALGGLADDEVLVVVEEDGRVLRAGDVASALDARWMVRSSWDPAVARAVDAGLLVTRMPRSLRRLGQRLASVTGEVR